MAHNQPPIVHVEGKLRRITTSGLDVPVENETTYRSVAASGHEINLEGIRKGRDYKNLRALLRGHGVSHHDPGKVFYPDQLLRRIMTRERVLEELNRMEERKDTSHIFSSSCTVSWYADQIAPLEELEPDIANGVQNAMETDTETLEHAKSGSKRYLKIFAILLLCQFKDSIKKFIDAGVCDQDLPLVRCNEGPGKSGLALRSRPHQKLQCFQNFKESNLDQFECNQYQFLVPYFCLSSNESIAVRHTKYFQRTILPWTGNDLRRENSGGYGHIYCKKIHYFSHGFHSVKQVGAGNGWFAVKMITTKQRDFQNERDMLQLFSGKHDHLINILMTYTLEGNNYLIFPWADCDLESYWKQTSPPYDPWTKLMRPDPMHWISKQILGIVSAVHKLHNPDHLHLVEDKRYAMHGDLKPENILWFKGNREADGILVVGDLGISSIHRKESRSNIPNREVPFSPDYRPPECDQEGGVISRAFDIWTLGCLLLEMITWCLGGWNMVEEFERKRMRVPYLGVRSNIYFDVQKAQDGGEVIMVKEAVIEWMAALHAHEGCTKYFHDLLDIIHNNMLVVLSKGKDRISSGGLLEKIREIDRRVSEREYGHLACPTKRLYGRPIAVKIKVNQYARERIDNFKGILGTYDGRAVVSKTPSEMKEVD